MNMYPFMHSPSTSRAQPPLGRRGLRLYTHQRDKTTLDMGGHEGVYHLHPAFASSATQWHTRYQPQGSVLILPLSRSTSTRVTFNISFHTSCPQPGSEEVRQSGSKHPRSTSQDCEEGCHLFPSATHRQQKHRNTYTSTRNN